jgi:hypothetical protein
MEGKREFIMVHLLLSLVQVQRSAVSRDNEERLDKDRRQC